MLKRYYKFEIFTWTSLQRIVDLFTHKLVQFLRKFLSPMRSLLKLTKLHPSDQKFPWGKYRVGGTAHFANTIILSGGHYFDNSDFNARAIVMVRETFHKCYAINERSHATQKHSYRKTQRMTTGPTSATWVRRSIITVKPLYHSRTHSTAREPRDGSLWRHNTSTYFEAKSDKEKIN